MKRRSGELKCYLIGHLNHLTKVDKLNSINLIQPISDIPQLHQGFSHICYIYIYISVRPIHLKNPPNPHRISTYILKKERKLN
jgi:hypothetical protein